MCLFGGWGENIFLAYWRKQKVETWCSAQRPIDWEECRCRLPDKRCQHEAGEETGMRERCWDESLHNPSHPRKKGKRKKQVPGSLPFPSSPQSPRREPLILLLPPPLADPPSSSPRATASALLAQHHASHPHPRTLSIVSRTARACPCWSCWRHCHCSRLPPPLFRQLTLITSHPL